MAVKKEVLFRYFLDGIREELLKIETKYAEKLAKLGVNRSSLAKFILEMREDGAKLQIRKPYSLKDLEVLGVYQNREKIGDEKKQRGLEKSHLIQCQKICEEAVKFDEDKLWAFACGFALGAIRAERDEDQFLKESRRVNNSIIAQKKRGPRRTKKFKAFIFEVLRDSKFRSKSGKVLAEYIRDNYRTGDEFCDFEIEDKKLNYTYGGKKQNVSFETLQGYLKEHSNIS